MAKRDAIRPIVKPRFTAGTGFTYVTRVNRRKQAYEGFLPGVRKSSW